eukprot:COSAG01_NODE_745_length_13872_cov_40.816525_3_plen_185_part_00
MHEGGLPAVSPAESAAHHLGCMPCPHGGGWHSLRASCPGYRRHTVRGRLPAWLPAYHCGIRSGWVNKQIKKRRHVKHLNCPHFCKVLYLDPAGEWSKKNPKFMEAITDIGVRLIQPPTQSDKRLGNRGETVVGITKRITQAGMLQTWLHVDMWEESCNYGWHTHAVLTHDPFYVARWLQYSYRL